MPDCFALGYEPGPDGADGHWTLRLDGGPALLDDLAAAAGFLLVGLHLGSALREPLGRLLAAIEAVRDVRPGPV